MSAIVQQSRARGAFHRRVEIATRETGPSEREARAAIEDDYHHFRVTLTARNGVVTDARSVALRFPNTLCPGAGARLSELLGRPVQSDGLSITQIIDPRQQCTHQFDLAVTALSALARGRAHRRYDVVVPDRVEGRTSATIQCDGQAALQWNILDTTIEGPAPYAGRSIGSGFSAFVRSLPADRAEAALILRRSVYISQGRGVDVSALGEGGPVGGCWAWQPERKANVVRIPSSRLDFAGRTQDLIAEDRDWLAFRV